MGAAGIDLHQAAVAAECAGGADRVAEAAFFAEFLEKLAPHGFVRVHRSRLRSFKPTPSGDLEIALDDGGVIAGRRRFRAAVER